MKYGRNSEESGVKIGSSMFPQIPVNNAKITYIYTYMRAYMQSTCIHAKYSNSPWTFLPPTPVLEVPEGIDLGYILFLLLSLRIYMCECVYIYVYIYIHLYMHIYIHICVYIFYIYI